MTASLPKPVKHIAKDLSDALIKVRRSLQLRAFKVTDGDQEPEFNGYGVHFVCRKENEQLAVVVIDKDEPLREANWRNLAEFVEGLEKPPNLSKLEIHQWNPPRPRWYTRHPKTFWTIVVGFVPVGGLLLAAATLYFNVAKKQTANDVPPLISTGTGGEQPLSVAQSPTPSAAGIQTKPIIVPPSHPISPPAGDTLEQSLNAYLLQQLGSSFAAHHYQRVYLKFWSPPISTYDNGSASCAVDGSIEYSGSDGGSILPEMTGPIRWSSVGDGRDQTVESACKKSVDDIIARYGSL